TVVCDESKHRAQIVHIQQEKTTIICQLEHDFEYAGLSVVELEYPAQQTRPHLTDRRPHRMAVLTIQIPEHDTIRLDSISIDSNLSRALLDRLIGDSRSSEARYVPFYIRHEHRNAEPGETFGQYQQRNGLTCSRCTGNKTMAVAILRKQADRFAGFSDE